MMVKAKYNQDVKSTVDEILLQFPGVVAGKMFEYPAYYLNKKIIGCIYEDGIGLKVPETIAKGNISLFKILLQLRLI